MEWECVFDGEGDAGSAGASADVGARAATIKGMSGVETEASVDEPTLSARTAASDDDTDALSASPAASPSSSTSRVLPAVTSTTPTPPQPAIEAVSWPDPESLLPKPIFTVSFDAAAPPHLRIHIQATLRDLSARGFDQRQHSTYHHSSSTGGNSTGGTTAGHARDAVAYYSRFTIDRCGMPLPLPATSLPLSSAALDTASTVGYSAPANVVPFPMARADAATFSNRCFNCGEFGHQSRGCPHTSHPELVRYNMPLFRSLAAASSASAPAAGADARSSRGAHTQRYYDSVGDVPRGGAGSSTGGDADDELAGGDDYARDKKIDKASDESSGSDAIARRAAADASSSETVADRRTFVAADAIGASASSATTTTDADALASRPAVVSSISVVDHTVTSASALPARAEATQSLPASHQRHITLSSSSTYSSSSRHEDTSRSPRIQPQAPPPESSPADAPAHAASASASATVYRPWRSTTVAPASSSPASSSSASSSSAHSAYAAHVEASSPTTHSSHYSSSATHGGGGGADHRGRYASAHSAAHDGAYSSSSTSSTYYASHDQGYAHHGYAQSSQSYARGYGHHSYGSSSGGAASSYDAYAYGSHSSYAPSHDSYASPSSRDSYAPRDSYVPRDSYAARDSYRTHHAAAASHHFSALPRPPEGSR